jgi:hypothetical protein
MEREAHRYLALAGQVSLSAAIQGVTQLKSRPVYDSYTTDPLFQKYYTAGWASLLAIGAVSALPVILAFLAQGRWREDRWESCLGVYEDGQTGSYERLDDEKFSTPRPRLSRRFRPVLAVASLLRSATLFTPRITLVRRRANASCHPTPIYLPFSIRTLLLALCIPTLILATLLPASQLRANPNRFGFLALASIPPLFILSSKNGVISVFLGRGWTAFNFLHRWLGRAVVLLVLLHFYFWTIQWQDSNQVGAFLSGSKERRGIGALSFLLLIAISSAKPFRRFSYPVFFVLHYAGVIGFLVFVNRHTVYARGWATWSVVAIYGFDILSRIASLRLRYVEIEPIEGGMVKMSMKGLKGGWR